MTRHPVPHGDPRCTRRTGCDRPECVTALADHRRRTDKQRILGIYAYIDAEPARRHVQRLLDTGMTWMQIQAATGNRVNRTQVKRLMGALSGKPAARTLRRDTARALLTVQPGDVTRLTRGAGVDPTGTRRRLQALVALGHPQRHLAARLGCSYENLYNTLHQSTFVQAETAHRVRQLYDQLWMTPGTSALARSVARRNGWVSPLAWDDDTIDDPAAQPAGTVTGAAGVDEVAVARAVSGTPTRLTRVELELAVARLHGQGFGDSAIADRLHIKRAHAEYLRRRVLRLPSNAAQARAS